MSVLILVKQQSLKKSLTLDGYINLIRNLTTISHSQNMVQNLVELQEMMYCCLHKSVVLECLAPMLTVYTANQMTLTQLLEDTW